MKDSMFQLTRLTQETSYDLRRTAEEAITTLTVYLRAIVYGCVCLASD